MSCGKRRRIVVAWNGSTTTTTFTFGVVAKEGSIVRASKELRLAHAPFAHRPPDQLSLAQKKGAAVRRPKPAHQTQVLRPSDDLLNGRVANLIGLKLRSSLNHLGQGLQHFWIACAVERVGLLLRFPETD